MCKLHAIQVYVFFKTINRANYSFLAFERIFTNLIILKLMNL